MTEPTFHIYQHVNDQRELVYQTPSALDAEDYCDEKNSQLAMLGVPSSVCYWICDGPHYSNCP